MACQSIQPNFFDFFQLQTVSLERGDYLFHQGQVFKGLYFIQHGMVVTQQCDADGVESIMQILSPGELIGFEGLGIGQYSLSCVALQTATIQLIPLKEINRLLIASPTLKSLLKSLSKQCATSPFIYKQYKSKNRVALFLNEMYQRLCRKKKDTLFEIPLTRQQIASYLGLSQETVCRELQNLQRAGIVSIRNRHYRLHCKERLTKWST